MSEVETKLESEVETEVGTNVNTFGMHITGLPKKVRSSEIVKAIIGKEDWAYNLHPNRVCLNVFVENEEEYKKLEQHLKDLVESEKAKAENEVEGENSVNFRDIKFSEYVQKEKRGRSQERNGRNSPNRKGSRSPNKRGSRSPPNRKRFNSKRKGSRSPPRSPPRNYGGRQYQNNYGYQGGNQGYYQGGNQAYYNGPYQQTVPRGHY